MTVGVKFLNFPQARQPAAHEFLKKQVGGHPGVVEVAQALLGQANDPAGAEVAHFRVGLAGRFSEQGGVAAGDDPFPMFVLVGFGPAGANGGEARGGRP
jgi:hypothetical protein